MNTFFKFLLLFFFSGLLVAEAQDEGYNEKESQYVRVSRNDDGSRTVFKRYPGELQLRKTTYDPNGRRVSTIMYYIDQYGEMRGCKVYDGDNNELFKVSYGYDQTGRLQKELMFDSKTSALISVFEHKYDDKGNKLTPVCKVFKKGHDPDNRFRYTSSTALEKNPFDEDSKTKSRGKSIK